MPYHIETSEFSFIQFSESDEIGSCNFADTDMCLLAYDDNDAMFQFVIRADEESEADALCNNSVALSIGIVEQCNDGFLLQFAQRPSRYRISSTRVLYVWQHGMPGFQLAISVGECFHFKIRAGAQSFCSNCFQRIGDDCHTSVIEFYNEDNAFGYNYCPGSTEEQDSDIDCSPIELAFYNQSSLTIPWTSYLQERFGDVPSVEVWVYENGSLIKPGIVAELDTYPPNEIRIDLGGSNQSGIVKIM